MIRRKVLILGAGHFAQEVADISEQTGTYEIIAFVESRDPSKVGQKLGNLPILWVDDIVRYSETHHAIAAIGNTHRDEFIEQVIAFGMPFATIIHPSAQLSPICSVGEGVFVGAGVVIAAHTRIDRHVLINRGCLIGHHTSIGEYCTLSPGANIAGDVTIQAKAFVGMGAQVLNNLKLAPKQLLGQVLWSRVTCPITFRSWVSPQKQGSGIPIHELGYPHPQFGVDRHGANQGGQSESARSLTESESSWFR
jgi:sugar O-acyltransferase (sialic acid O-acetyltransferase NeuD family)